MKKTTKSNPLKFFNDAKATRNKSFSKSLTKAQNGIFVKKDGMENLSDPNKYVMNKTNIFGNTKFKEISKKKFDRVSNRYSNQKGSESLGTNESIGQQVISGRNKKNYVSRVDEVREAELEGRYPDYKTEEQELILDPKRQLKKGGSVKSKKK